MRTGWPGSQGLKPTSLMVFYGTAESRAPPFPPASSLFGHLALLGESFLNVALDFRTAHQPEHPVNNLAVPADVEGRGQILNSAVLSSDFLFADQDRIIYAQLPSEL